MTRTFIADRACCIVQVLTVTWLTVSCSHTSTQPNSSSAATNRNNSGSSASAGHSAADAGPSANAGKDSGQAGNTPPTGNGGQGAAGHVASAAGHAAVGGANARDDDAGVVSPLETVYVSGYGSDISVFGLDTGAGKLSKRSTVNGGMSPSYLAIAPNKRFLYAINEADAPASQVVAFTVGQSDGHLTQINTAKTGGSGAPYLSVHPSGKWIAVAHYTSGETSILPVLANGGVGDPSTVNKGPGAGCVQAHQTMFDASGKHLFVPCLGSNFIIQFKFSDTGQLTYNEPQTVAVSGGPRHIAFDPQEHHAYVISETGSLITWFDYDSTTGLLSNPQMISSVKSMTGESAQIVVHPSGKWLYTSNRTENSLGLFSIDAQGKPKAVTFETDMLAEPRDFSIDPLGKFLLLANQNGDQNVLVYRIADADGRLTRTQIEAVGGSPCFTKAIQL